MFSPAKNESPGKDRLYSIVPRFDRLLSRSSTTDQEPESCLYPHGRVSSPAEADGLVRSRPYVRPCVISIPSCVAGGDQKWVACVTAAFVVASFHVDTWRVNMRGEIRRFECEPDFCPADESVGEDLLETIHGTERSTGNSIQTALQLGNSMRRGEENSPSEIGNNCMSQWLPATAAATG